MRRSPGFSFNLFRGVRMGWIFGRGGRPWVLIRGGRRRRR